MCNAIFEIWMSRGEIKGSFIRIFRSLSLCIMYNSVCCCRSSAGQTISPPTRELTRGRNLTSAPHAPTVPAGGTWSPGLSPDFLAIVWIVWLDDYFTMRLTSASWKLHNMVQQKTFILIGIRPFWISTLENNLQEFKNLQILFSTVIARNLL